ncbi:Iron-regulated ABC transporter ATPase subunit SufC [Psychromonas ingrahamii 37]|uniref:Iron-regulated ABC transporter ATPase subunit SufC n=1 Tax=Psychromonas ingrahamii (strain DSM 17664 / CCUG 51855 / 37) TaxID=357804 RepID=A1SV05_PSYIN|nr:Fe-S cluster assembly ATPase SufC [Psychromonas ingrahamii]ABM03320.1 Iron-regulated ABC transporter ATPase subunit SufC [Psychromonas ingrahamii 37]
MLNINNLHAEIQGNMILKGLNLSVKSGEVHAIMGPNGSGKSTLANVLAGHPDYQVTTGEVIFQGRDLLTLSVAERACAGVFVAFQYPLEIPGVSNVQFLKLALNSQRKYRQLSELDALDFLQLVKTKVQQVGMEEPLLYRSINEGFSGGEKKRNEILQMLVLEPQLAILDETDSGLDIDALKLVAQGINAFRNSADSGQKPGIILVTHYQRLLNFINPDFVHILFDGRIVKSGGPELALELERKGYADLLPKAPSTEKNASKQP